jgi:hypothetical protein
MAAEASTGSDSAWERHSRMWKLIGVVSVVLFISSQVVNPAVGIPLLFVAMATFVLAAWHFVLFYKGKRERASTAG